METHHEDAGKARETFRQITPDVAWVAETPKPHKAVVGRARDLASACSAIGDLLDLHGRHDRHRRLG